MTLSHLILQGGLWLTEVHFRQVMFVESAQGFVFLSGLMIGIVQGRRLLRKGEASMRASIRSRMIELWLWTIGLVFTALLARDLLPGGVEAWHNWLATARLDDPVRVFAILTLMFQPTFMDILPMYILFMAAAPMVLRWVMAGRWMLAVGAAALVWTACQLGVMQIFSIPLDQLLETGDKQGLRMAFDPMGWQLPFMAGVILGGLWVSGQIKWENLLGPRTRDLALVAGLFMLFFAPLRIATAHGLMPDAMLKVFAPFEQRSNFGPVYLLNFAAAAFLFAWLAIGGATAPQAWIRALSQGMRWFFTRPALCLLGRHSLHVYAWHVVLVYALRYIDASHSGGGVLVNTTLGLYVLALLWLPPLWRERARVPAAAPVAPPLIGPLPPQDARIEPSSRSR
ncbi:OpgC domain-containing protein [Pseudooceanicola sp. CBS1P-1]|uniref:OpgC domain-containing protein n=2 Tax=Paracoccaceae TaxID=31989 RepID=A0A6L7G7C0_9RHOB|nr:OpgC domain-containing protein [Pseudooceanicola endophyticus]MXN18573.1 hypothetical protein [Pseudooceanicola albus]